MMTTTMMPVLSTGWNLCRCQCCVWMLPMMSFPRLMPFQWRLWSRIPTWPCSLPVTVAILVFWRACGLDRAPTWTESSSSLLRRLSNRAADSMTSPDKRTPQSVPLVLLPYFFFLPLFPSFLQTFLSSLSSIFSSLHSILFCFPTFLPSTFFLPSFILSLLSAFHPSFIPSLLYLILIPPFSFLPLTLFLSFPSILMSHSSSCHKQKKQTNILSHLKGTSYWMQAFVSHSTSVYLFVHTINKSLYVIMLSMVCLLKSKRSCSWQCWKADSAPMLFSCIS